jgi:hypothetical protein
MDDMNKADIDLKGILSFLAITFAATYAAEGGLILSGFRFTALPAAYGQIVVAGAMWIPGLAAVVCAKYITKDGLSIARVRLGPLRPYLGTAAIVPAIFAITYAVSWSLGLVQLDWRMTAFRSTIAEASGTAAPAVTSPALVLLGVFLATSLIAPFVNGMLAFGEELGWRGYLLPKLLPLGKPWAYALLGVIWALWHMPLIAIGFTYPGQPILGFVVFTGLTTALGIYLGEMTLRYNSSVLAGWIHGLFNSQKLGVWPILFPNANPLLGGYSGIIGVLLWFLLGLGQAWQDARQPPVVGS